MKSTLVVLYAETPLHAGSGVGLGAVDLPIQRERMSGLPMIQGSGIKGALRERMRPRPADEPASQNGRLEEQDFFALFGPWAPKRKGSKSLDDEQGEALDDEQESKARPKPDEFAGALALMDARILLFPVRTAFGGFAWLTCPLILDRLMRDLALPPADLDKLQPREGQALVTKSSVVSRAKSLIIEDMEYEAVVHEAVDTLATWLKDNVFPAGKEYDPFRERVKKQLAVVDDTEFTFLSKHATEVVARTSIDQKTGTVSGGALWTEESLPSETVLWTMATFADSRNPRREGKSENLCELFTGKVDELSRIYLGGDRSVGRGMVGLRLVPARQDGGDR